MTQRAKPPEDTFQIRCPKLGHQIHFSYCRRENSGLPCARIVTCWHPYFRVTAYLRLELTEEEWQEAMEKPVKPKVLTLVELIEQAQKRKKDGKD
jgi:hypothetical protein